MIPERYHELWKVQETVAVGVVVHQEVVDETWGADCFALLANRLAIGNVDSVAVLPEFCQSTKPFSQPKLPNTWLGQY